jgi:hypothetical protein
LKNIYNIIYDITHLLHIKMNNTIAIGIIFTKAFSRDETREIFSHIVEHIDPYYITNRIIYFYSCIDESLSIPIIRITKDNKYEIINIEYSEYYWDMTEIANFCIGSIYIKLNHIKIQYEKQIDDKREQYGVCKRKREIDIGSEHIQSEHIWNEHIWNEHIRSEHSKKIKCESSD